MLENVKTILVIDWPSRTFPKPWRSPVPCCSPRRTGPEDYSAFEVQDGKVAVRHVGRMPEHADLVYSHRPLAEMPEIIATALSLHAKAVWIQSGLSAAGIRDGKGCWIPEAELALARQLAVSAGLEFIAEPYIGDAARDFAVTKAGADRPIG